MGTFLNVFRIPDLRNKVLFTLLMIATYRFGAFIPVPGIDLDAVATLRTQAEEGGVLGFLQLFSGGALTQFAVFALGIMPYITSSIIMQILTVVIPKLEQWQAQGAVGQRKITQWTRYVTVGIAIMQSTGLVFLFHNGGGGFFANVSTNLDLVPNFTIPRVLLIVVTLTAGTALIMWIGELHHPAGHRQRHVDPDLHLGGQLLPVDGQPGPGRGRQHRPRRPADPVRLPDGGHRLRRAGPASDPGAVRQAGGRAAACTAARAPTSR